MLHSQPRFDLVLHHPDNHFRSGPFLNLAFCRESVRLGGSVAALASIARQLFANRPLAQPGGLRDLDLGSSGLLHVCYYLTVYRAEAVVFVTHSQFVLKPD